ncbi:unnamed protein product [Phaeothamnion confervicola]
MLTHTADCVDCDFRVARVPRKESPGPLRPVFVYKPQFPHIVNDERSETWTMAALQAEGWSQIDLWNYTAPLGSIPEAASTNAVLEGIYAMANDRGVAIGESTCAGRFYALPAGVRLASDAGGSDDVDGSSGDAVDGGDAAETAPAGVTGDAADDTIAAGSDGGEIGAALLDVSELTRIGLERSASARQCVEVIGGLAERHGFYGSEWEDGGQASFLEAGEALIVADGSEVWVFHVLSDDTGASALWVAQRLPQGHVAVLANQFIIRSVPRAGEPGAEDFMYSDNLWDVAASHGLWDPAGTAQLDFAAAFQPTWSYSDRLATRRVWRVFSKVAPVAAAALPVDTNGWADDYPFSIAAEAPLTVEDMFALNRDHYEGTAYDLTVGAAAGPYGDPTRAGPGASLDGSVTEAMAMAGGFERAISLHRTSISTVVQIRPVTPPADAADEARVPSSEGTADGAAATEVVVPETAAAVWLSLYHPSMAAYAPMYAAAPSVPKAYTIGSLFRYDPDAAFWSFAALGNYATRWYRFTQPEVAALATALEDSFRAEQPAAEAAAAAAFLAGDAAAGAAALSGFSQRSGDAVVAAFKELLPRLIARYHDGYRMRDATAAVIEFERLFYPRSWLEAVGYWGKENAALAALGIPTTGAAATEDVGAAVASGGGVEADVNGVSAMVDAGIAAAGGDGGSRSHSRIYVTEGRVGVVLAAVAVASAALGYALSAFVAGRARKKDYFTITC